MPARPGRARLGKTLEPSLWLHCAVSGYRPSPASPIGTAGRETGRERQGEREARDNRLRAIAGQQVTSPWRTTGCEPLNVRPSPVCHRRMSPPSPCEGLCQVGQDEPASGRRWSHCSILGCRPSPACPHRESQPSPSGARSRPSTSNRRGIFTSFSLYPSYYLSINQ